MCGIVGYLGPRDPKWILFQGLQRLEYRGYDSAGIAFFQDEKIVMRRAPGKLSALRELLHDPEFEACPHQGLFVGIGHTRWATHGIPSEANAHPHRSARVSVVHNGIIDNFVELKEAATHRGVRFSSDTDTEVIAHLIEEALSSQASLEEAVRHTANQLRGSYALGIISETAPHKLIAVRNSAPLLIGLGEGETFIASDVTALVGETKRILHLDDGELAVLEPQGVSIKTLRGKTVRKKPKTYSWTPEMVEKRGYPHFMLKEIHEQPLAIRRTLAFHNLTHPTEQLFDLPLLRRNYKKIFLVACGTAWHASLVGKYLIEHFSKIPTEVDLASEFRYRDPIVDRDCLLVVTSQSGETADSLAALREGKEKGATVLAICNTRESTIAREADAVLYTDAGPEIGVASTKAFTTQLLMMNLLALELAKNKGMVETLQRLTEEIYLIPTDMETILSQEPRLREIAEKFYAKRTFLYLGRGSAFPIALEGALKLKEISYINAEGYPAGEMKHGPIALVDDETPVVILAPQDKNYEKVIGNLEEIRARKGIVIAIGSQEDKLLPKLAQEFIGIPHRSWNVIPMLLSLPVQLLAYYIALKKGTDVDQPRNLAKSVTVE